jgi:hypothetical protein
MICRPAITYKLSRKINPPYSVIKWALLSVFVLASLIFSSCKNSAEEVPLLLPVPQEVSGIDFTNTLEYTEELNPYTFKNFYNGGGVAIGDINNDGLSDVFFCGNMVSNKLYLNKGELRFEEITGSANVQSMDVWSTGVSMVDINADGYLDIYVCKSGPPGTEKRANELFINNGDLTFTEKATDYGLDNIGLGVHTAFLDYDKDGDLDCYLLNNAIKSIGSFGIVKDKRLIPDSLGANKLYRNDEGYFNDITSESGIYSSEIGFGLGAMVGDVNGDNWPDIFISNDFFEKDYLYINQKDGTFEDHLEEYVKEISMGSMGADFADINNDGFSEYFVSEMLPARRDRQVTKAFFDNWEGLKNSQDKGYYNQFSRNTLQLNNGDGTFSEIGRYAGVEATDWSWAALIFDIDNDAMKDIFVANGIYKDLLDLDYLTFMSNPDMVRARIRTNQEAVKSMIDMMPSEPIPNYFFLNNGDLTFTNKVKDWKLEQPTFSNGSAYGDLDNDGDLDLVVNNVNMPSFIYENRSRQVYPERSYLAIKLNGSNGNTMAIGTKVKLYTNGQTIYQEQNPARGFESSVDYKIVVGLNNVNSIDSLEIVWPSDKITRLMNVKANQVLELSEEDGKPLWSAVTKKEKTLFDTYDNPQLSFRHEENKYSDFSKDRLLFHMNSTEGPCICKGDINGDGREDFYVGGASGQSGKIFVQSNDEQFIVSDSLFRSDAQSEDQDCAFFDANNDGYMDLYVATGGSEFGSLSLSLKDRFYLGDKDGAFKKSDQRLPLKGFESTSVVLPYDFDQDGDMDLFVGGRSVPYFYGIPADSYLLENDGKGTFSIPKDESLNLLNRLGMVTDATLADLDQDGIDELIVVGRWMPVKIFNVSKGKLSDVSDKWGLEKSDGWYNTVVAEDLNNDGRSDILVGNHGLNTRFHASEKEPIEMMVGDFDESGTLDQIISMYSDGKKYPFVQLRDLAEQLPIAANQYSSYNEYKNDDMNTVFPQEIRKKGQIMKAYNLASGLFINEGSKLVFEKFPMEAQISPVYMFETGDFTGNGSIDIVLGGNFEESKPEVGSYLASFGALLESTDDGHLKFVPANVSGLKIEGCLRDAEQIQIGNKNILIFTRNNNEIISMQYDKME